MEEPQKDLLVLGKLRPPKILEKPQHTCTCDGRGAYKLRTDLYPRFPSPVFVVFSFSSVLGGANTVLLYTSSTTTWIPRSAAQLSVCVL